MQKLCSLSKLKEETDSNNAKENLCSMKICHEGKAFLS